MRRARRIEVTVLRLTLCEPFSRLRSKLRRKLFTDEITELQTSFKTNRDIMPKVQPIIEYRDVRCSHSENLPDLLTRLRLSILISTYQTGHLVVVAARQGKLVLSFHQFERAMGVAVKPGCIAVCTGKEVWFARSAPDIAAKLAPRAQYDACFLARTLPLHGRPFAPTNAAWVGNEWVWVVNTLFSCNSPRCTLVIVSRAALETAVLFRHLFPEDRFVTSMACSGCRWNTTALRHATWHGGNQLRRRLAACHGQRGWLPAGNSHQGRVSGRVGYRCRTRPRGRWSHLSFAIRIRAIGFRQSDDRPN